MEITVSLPGSGRADITFEKDFGGTLDAARSLFGDELIYSFFEDAAIIRSRNPVKARMKAKNEDGSWKHTDEECAAAGTSHVLTAAGPRKESNPFKAIVKQVETGKMTREEAKKKLKEQLDLLS